MSAIREEEFQSKKVEWGTWKKVLHYAMPYKRDLVTIMLCMTMSGITDVLMPMSTAFAIDNFVMPGRLEGLPYCSRRQGSIAASAVSLRRVVAALSA